MLNVFMSDPLSHDSCSTVKAFFAFPEMLRNSWPIGLKHWPFTVHCVVINASLSNTTLLNVLLMVANVLYIVDA